MLSFTTAADKENFSVSYSLISYFIDPKKIENFLKNTQTGAAHDTYGTDISVLVKHLTASFILCIIQLLFFCYLRGVITRFYQPRSAVDREDALDSTPEGMFNWIIPTWSRKSTEYIEMGLDAYFFLRFIRFLLKFFLLAGVINLAVLIPVNLMFNDETFVASGLDRFSISNISKRRVKSMNFYFVCSLVTIGLFEVLIRKEFQYIADTRQDYLNSWRHRCKISSRVILLGNIPEELGSPDALSGVFDQFPGGVEHIWPLDDYHEYVKHYLQASEAVEIIEYHLLTLSRSKKKILEGCLALSEISKKKIYPSIYLPLKLKPVTKQATYIWLPGAFRFLVGSKKVGLVSWSMQTLENSSFALEERISELSTYQNGKMSKAFILFRTQESAYMAHQALLSPEYGKMDESLVEVDKNDIIWQNLMRRSGVTSAMIRHVINGIIIVLICLYVIPVSLITLVSQIPLLTQLLPFMGFLKKLPKEVGLIFSSLFPTLILSFLTEIQQMIFRFLLLMKGHWTGAEIELDLQVWYFVFVFVQQFLVVSVLTSLVVVFLSVVEKPASIPLLLAENIPMSSIFFFKFLSVKAFALCGSDFLKIRALLRWLFKSKVFDRTPRQKKIRTRQLTRVQWGSVYASFSVYGAIGIIYSTIAPLVSLFMVVLLVFFMLYYKHALKYMYSAANPSETNGRLYPRAIFQLYTGIYCFEFCMVGIFLSLRDEKSEHTLKLQALIMSFVFGLSVSSNVVTYTRFQKLFRFIPQLKHKPEIVEEDGFGGRDDINLKERSLLYLHPCYQYQKPVIWLPADSDGNSERILRMLSGFTNAIAGGSIDGNYKLQD